MNCYQKQPDVRKRRSDKRKLRYKTDAQYRKRLALINKRSELKRLYDITLSQYFSLLDKQHGQCALCRAFTSGRKLDVDHDHVTKKVRGLLCRRCNRMLGLANDRIELLYAAIRYLKHSKHIVTEQQLALYEKEFLPSEPKP